MVILAISFTLTITMAILHWNYIENTQRKLSKKHTILNHWGKEKPLLKELEELHVKDSVIQQTDTDTKQMRSKTGRKR